MIPDRPRRLYPRLLRRWAALPALGLSALLVSQSGRATALPASRLLRPAHAREAAPLALDTLLPLSPTAWLVGGIEQDRRYELDDAPQLDLLQRYRYPGTERVPAWRRYFHGRFGVQSWEPWTRLTWNAVSCEVTRPPPPETFTPRGPALSLESPGTVAPLPASLMQLLAGTPADLATAPEPELLGVAVARRCPPWKRMHPVTFARYDGEFDRFTLLGCDGSIAPDALDRLSVIARPPGVPRPELPLPLEPDPASQAQGEWVPGVKMLHPRLLWVVQRIAAAFPWRTIVVVSGYRREAATSYHDKGRALDLAVRGVPDKTLFRFCHEKLRDVGCGYYPNNRFVHVDVRPYGTGHPMWIDVSMPGTPSRYVDSWPGITGSGALGQGGEK